jgi:hypothetical protein
LNRGRAGRPQALTALDVDKRIDNLEWRMNK